MDWILLVSVVILCFIVHRMREEIEALKIMTDYLIKKVCKEEFEKAKQIYEETYGESLE